MTQRARKRCFVTRDALVCRAVRIATAVSALLFVAAQHAAPVQRDPLNVRAEPAPPQLGNQPQSHRSVVGAHLSASRLLGRDVVGARFSASQAVAAPHSFSSVPERAALLLPQGKAPAQTQRASAKSPAAPRASSTSDELHKLGEALAKAVLDKNIDALLTYDRADLRAADAESLKNAKSDLYCYLFDSECITWGDGNWRSVYEKLSSAKSLQIKVNLVRSSADRQLYGSLLFYDASTIAAKDLRSFEFVCKEAPARVASWRFRLENGKWKAVTPLFDSETLGACPSPPRQDDDEDKDVPLPLPTKP